MPMLCPSVPIDKNKQGGRNLDASKMIDFKKVGTITKGDTSKLNAGVKNRDPRTDLDEHHRAAVLISGLRTNPRALCSVCPGVITSNIITDQLPPSSITILQSVTFFVLYSTSPGLFYNNNTIYYGSINPNNKLTNYTLNSTYLSMQIGPSDSLSSLPANASRQVLIDTLNTRLLTHKWNSGNSWLVSDIDSTGRLVLSVSGTQISGTHTPPYFAGLFFGDSPNGSTSLGVTNQNGTNGVDAAALVLIEGQTSVTAPYRIGEI